jgi:GntR family carbon starvation induced transcriptional regulator
MSLDLRERIRADIMAGRVKPGDKLRFAGLQTRYDAGIGTLREALTHLASEGFVRFDKGQGFRVAPLSVEDLLDITELRLDFEARALSDAMKRGDEKWEARIVAAYHLLSRSESVPLAVRLRDPDEWTIRHRSFHLALVEACKSNWLRSFHQLLFDQAQRYRIIALRNRPGSTSRASEHKAIMEAVLGRDEKKAIEAARRHINKTVADVLKYTPQLAGYDGSANCTSKSRKPK